MAATSVGEALMYISAASVDEATVPAMFWFQIWPARFLAVNVVDCELFGQLSNQVNRS